MADWEAAELAHELAYDLVRRAYKLEDNQAEAA
jgi:hypothetical protein